MLASKNWVNFNKMFTLSPWLTEQVKMSKSKDIARTCILFPDSDDRGSALIGAETFIPLEWIKG
jgi:hypothetical protein